MTKEDLEKAYERAKKSYEDFGLEACPFDVLKTLLLWELWRDGAPWKTIQELDKDFTYTTEATINSLINVFGYKEGK